MSNHRPSSSHQQPHLVLCPLVVDGYQLTLTFLFYGFFPDLCTVSQNGDFVLFRFVDHSTWTAVGMDLLQGFQLWINVSQPGDYVTEMNAITRDTVREHHNGMDYWNVVRRGRYYPGTADGQPSTVTADEQTADFGVDHLIAGWRQNGDQFDGDHLTAGWRPNGGRPVVDRRDDDGNDENENGGDGGDGGGGDDNRDETDPKDDGVDRPAACGDHTYTRLR